MQCDTEIRILVANTPIEDQIEVSLSLPLITKGETVGYDLIALAHKAMQAYSLDPRLGVTVDCWQNTYSSFLIDVCSISSDSNEKQLISPDDLIV